MAVIVLTGMMTAVWAEDRTGFPRQNPERVKEIAATLRPEAGFAETRVGSRAAWERIVAADPKAAQGQIARGEAVLAKPMTKFDDAEYFTVDPNSGDVGVWYTKETELTGQLRNLVFAECLEGKGRFVKRIAETLDNFASLRTWVIPYHDRKGRSFNGEIRKIELIGGIATEEIARTVDLLRDVLPPETVAQAKKAVWDKELDVYVGAARDIAVARQNDCSWLWSVYNWNAACNFYMVSTAVYVLDDPKLRAECIELAERSITYYLSGFSKDGLSLEGPSYWDYGFGSYLMLALQVRRATGGKVPFVTDFSEKVMASGFDNRYNDVNAPGYGDSSSTELMGPPTETWFRGSLVWPRFACPLADRRGLKSGLFLTTLTGFPSVGLPQGVSYATPYSYPFRTWYGDGAQQLVCRPKTGVTNALYAAIKGGDNGVGHNHNDIGTYTVAVDGYELVCDPGCKAYDQDTFTAKRYEENTRNSYGHPVPYVDGTMQSAGTKFAARVVSTSFSDACDEVKLDLKGAYANDKVDKLVRRFTYRRDRGQLVVTDGVRLKEPGAFESPIVTFGTVTPKGDGLYEIVYKGGRCRVMCRVQATGGRLVTKSEELSFIGRKGDPRARGIPTRFTFAFAEPVTEATIAFTYWIPQGKLSDFAEVGPEEYRPLRRELRGYYPEECHERMRNAAVSNSFARIWSDVEAWFAAHPEADALDVRRENYRAMRRHYHPVLFRESPFYFESGVAGGYSVRDVRGSCAPGNVTRLLCQRFYHDRGFVPDEEFRVLRERTRQQYSYICGPFVDQIHNMPPFRKILENGFGGMKARVEKTLADCPDEDQDGRRYLEAMLEGLETVRYIQLAFRDEAVRRLERAETPRERKWLERIAESAARCPWEPPRTFFEGLNTLWFCREVFGYVDGLSCFSLGHPDMWLIDLYRQDLAAGRIAEDEMHDLVRRFMIQAECHHDGFRPVMGSVDHEMETPITLGGTDAKGVPVWNELTRAFLCEHQAMDVVFPKLHVRYSKDSPKEYLETIAKQVLEGHCVFAMFNDETHVRGFLKDGYSLERACDYEGVGCWEGAISSSTDAQFANYTSVIKPFVAAIYRNPEAERRARVSIEPFEGCASIDELKRRALRNYLLYVRDLLSTYTRYGRFFSKVAPRPLYSACLDGCLERRRDEFDGGLEFQPRSITLGFLANVVDSICAIDKVVFRDRFCTLDEFLAAVRANWQGERNEAIREEALKAPYWGDDSDESNGLMKWWIDSISDDFAGLTADRGRPNKLACLIYREFLYWGEGTPATPDGRRTGDRFAQGFAPSEYRCKGSVTDVFNAIGSLDHSRLWASNANLMFDGSGLTPEALGATFRVFAKKGAHMLQPNSVSVETLLDAQAHPERHLDIIVKVCGFSARFVALSPRWQQEVIERHQLKGFVRQ